MIQLFKTYPNKEKFIEFIKAHCVKERKCYKLSPEVYKQITFNNELHPFLDSIKEHYHSSKQVYVSRKMTYARFVTIIRHLCKILEITYTSTMKYSSSTYQIDYLIYLNDQE